MGRLDDATVVVAGGTGNIGSLVVRALLEDGARVSVPSRSREKLHDLAEYLRPRISADALARLSPFVGDIGAEDGAQRIAEQVMANTGVPTAVFATLGRFTPTPTLLEASAGTLEDVLRDYLVAHYVAARAFLSQMRSVQSKYVFINGPLAFEPWENTASGFVSVATAAQHMLFRALALELRRAPLEVIELVIHTFVRDRKTQPGATISGEDVGAYAADLVAGTVRVGHGESLHLVTRKAAIPSNG